MARSLLWRHLRREKKKRDERRGGKGRLKSGKYY
jgi:hypothetical protein